MKRKKIWLIGIAFLFGAVLIVRAVWPPKLWTDEELLGYMYEMYGVEFEIVSSEPGTRDSHTIHEKKYEVRPITGPDINVYARSAVTFSNGLYPGYGHTYYDNDISLMFHREMASLLEGSSIPYETEDGEISIFLNRGNIEENIKATADLPTAWAKPLYSTRKGPGGTEHPAYTLSIQKERFRLPSWHPPFP